MLYLLAVRVAVLGFGWAGVLAAGFLLEKFPGTEVVAFDKSQRLGGLLSSAEIDGFTFDVGGSHVIFSNDKAVLAEMVALLGGEALEHQRKAYVRLGDLFVPYPFENGLYVLPPEERAELIGDLVEALMKIPPGWRPKHLLDWIETTFGNGIARRYLIPYNEKIWKRPLDQISADWVYIPGRLPVPDVKTLVKTAARNPHSGLCRKRPLLLPPQRRHTEAVPSGAGEGWGQGRGPRRRGRRGGA
jgi:UDP-galactopyranose mutase (EC 5.4.99.9)